jgi:adenylate kinase
MKKILFTGQVGLNRSAYLEEVKQKIGEKGLSLSFKLIGPLMIANYTGKIDDTTILNLPKALLDLLSNVTWKNVLSELKNSQGKSCDFFVINAHSVFRWHHGLFPSLDLELVREFAPDMVLVLIDDVIKVKKGLQERGTDFFNLWELFAWREEEIWFAKFVADSISRLLSKEVRFFLIPKFQGPDLFVRLITEGQKPKTYVSFPITGVQQEETDEIDEFKKKLNEEFIVFDPYSIRDRELTSTCDAIESEITGGLGSLLDKLEDYSQPEGTIWTTHKDDLSLLTLCKLRFEIELLGRDLVSVLETIDSQIISRDYMLIDQSDFVVMYIRMDDEGNPLISAGCQSEMVYAYGSGKEVYVIFAGGERRLSPWVTQFSKAFTNLGEAFDFIMREHGRKK